MAERQYYNKAKAKADQRKAYVSDIPVVPIQENWRSLFKLEVISSIERLRELRDKFLQNPELIATDSETTSKYAAMADLVGFSLCFSPEEAFYVPVAHKLGVNLPFEESVAILREVLYAAKRVLVFNYRYDMTVFRKYGMNPMEINHFDVQLLIWNLDTNMKFPSLKGSSLKYLGITQETFAQVTETSEKTGRIDYLAPEVAGEYGAADSLCTFLLFLRFKEFFERNQFILLLDNELERVLLYHEDEEIPIDPEYAQQVALIHERTIDRIKGEIHEMCGRVFDVNSTQQLQEVLLGMGVPLSVRTKTGFSTDEKSLTPLAHDFPIVEKVFEYRGALKELSSYYRPFINWGKPWCRIHYTTVNAPTGRLASGGTEEENEYFLKINIQSMPKAKTAYYLPRRSDEEGNILGWMFDPCDKGTPGHVEGKEQQNVRRVIKPHPGHYVFSIDYDAEELVIAANISEDPVWLIPMVEGKDPHQETALTMVSADEYTSALRAVAKVMNYGGLYGGSEWSFRTKLPGKPIEELRDYFQKWKKSHQAYFAYMARCFEYARRTGFIKTLLGRIRRVGFYAKTNPQYFENTVSNTQIQGLAADIIRYDMVRLFQRLFLKDRYKGHIRFLMNMHDELDYSITKELGMFTEIAMKIKNTMEDLPFNWKKGLTTSMSVGNDWGLIFPFEYKDGEWIPG